MLTRFIVFTFILIFRFGSNSLMADDFLVVANVNEELITKNDLEDRMRLFYLLSPNVNISKDQLKSQMTNRMSDEIIKAQIAKKFSISVSDEVIQEEMIKMFRLSDIGNVKINLVKNDISYDDCHKYVEYSLLWSKFIFEVVAKEVNVGKSEVDEFFEQVKNEKSHYFNLSMISFSVSKNNKRSDVYKFAKIISNSIKNDTDFDKIVEQISSNIMIDNSGDMGWIKDSDLSEDIIEKVRGLKKGEATEPIFIEDGYYIFRLNDEKYEYDASKMNQKEIENIIYRKKILSNSKKYFQEFYKNSFIKLY